MIKIKLQHDIIDFCIDLLSKSIIKNFTTKPSDIKVGNKYEHISTDIKHNIISKNVYINVEVVNIIDNLIVFTFSKLLYKLHDDNDVNKVINNCDTLEKIYYENQLYIYDYQHIGSAIALELDTIDFNK